MIPGAYYLSKKEKLALSLIAGKLMYDELTDEEKGWVDTLEDAGSIAIFSGVIFQLWVPPQVKAVIMARVSWALRPLAAPVIGFVVGYIAGAEIAEVLFPGEGRKQFKEFWNEPTKIPEKIAFTAATIYEHKILPPIVQAANWYVETIDELIEAWKFSWSLTRPRSLW